MIRFVDLGKQLAVDETDPEYQREFAFFDTISSEFLSFDGQQVFHSWEDFLEQCEAQNCTHDFLRRVCSLIPSWVPRGKPTIPR